MSKLTSPNIQSIVDKLKELSKTIPNIELVNIVKDLEQLDCIPNINYQSIYDEAMAMAYTLNKIEQQTHDCAMCKGDYQGGYSTDDYLKNICEILYGSEGYHKMDKYNRVKKE